MESEDINPTKDTAPEEAKVWRALSTLEMVYQRDRIMIEEVTAATAEPLSATGTLVVTVSQRPRSPAPSCGPRLSAREETRPGGNA